MHLFALQIDWTLSLTTVVNAAVGALLIAVGHGLRKVYKAFTAFVASIQSFDRRLEDTAAVVDGHSLVLKGLDATAHFPKVSQRRRETDDRDGRMFQP